MDWLILLLLVPAIVAPIVLSLGFAGCGFQTSPSISSDVTIVSAIPLPEHVVDLTWTYTGSEPATFDVRRKTGDAGWLQPIRVDPTVADGKPYSFRDDSLTGFTSQPLQPGTRYTYSVRVVSTSFDGTPGPAWSADAVIETYSTAFTSPLPQSGVDEAVNPDCVVQRVSPGTLSHGGNLVAITLRGPSLGELNLSSVTVSRPAQAGHDYNSQSTPIKLNTLPVNLHGLPQPAGAGEINVDVDEALLVAFDIEYAGQARVVRGVAHTAYIKRAPDQYTKIAEAGTALRTGFVEHPNELWLIDSISIATKWPIS